MGIPRARSTREAVKRALLATLLVSHGTPMRLAGDERGRTQHGNNNAYCQDNDIFSVDWNAAAPEIAALHRFIARLIAARNAHSTLRATRFLHGKNAPSTDIRDVGWFDTDGTEMTPEAVNKPAALLLLVRRACAGEVTLVLSSGTAEDRQFPLPPQLSWQVIYDTSDPDAETHPLDGMAFNAVPRAVVLLPVRP